MALVVRAVGVMISSLTQMWAGLAVGTLVYVGLTPAAAAAQSCPATIAIPTTSLGPDAHWLALNVSAVHGCRWRLRSSDQSVVFSVSSGVGSATVSLWFGANETFASREVSIYLDSRLQGLLTQRASEDADRDTLPDSWERQFGLTVSTVPESHDALADPDSDGVSNGDEWRRGTHPRGGREHQWLFAEGASGTLITSLSLANFELISARVLVTLSGPRGVLRRVPLEVPPFLPRTLELDQLFSVDSAEFGITIDSDRPIVAERTTSWRSAGGAQSERGLTWQDLGSEPAGPATEWLVAEGTTQAGVNLFYLLHNISEDEAAVQIDFLRPNAPAVVKTYQVPGSSRLTIWVNQDLFELAPSDVSARVRSNRPLLVDYAYYRSSADGGHVASASAHAASPSAETSWHFAEGTTGPFFDTFLALLNPGNMSVTATVRYLVDGGDAVTRSYAVPPLSRVTVWVDQDASLTNRAFGIDITASGPLVAQRSMWWPGEAATWYEAHTSGPVPLVSLAHAAAGSLREGEDTYFLVANPSDAPVLFEMTLYSENGFATLRNLLVEKRSRLTISSRALFPELNGQRFSARFRTLIPEQRLAIERSTYRTVDGVIWAEGSAAPVK